jgi:type IV fimbrial biogenesis protein FimT
MKTTRAMMSRQGGYTLIEMLVALTIAGVLASMAAPSFSDTIVGMKVSGYSSNLASSAMLARSEAIKRNAVVSLCASSNGATCGGRWEQGWLVMCKSTDMTYCDPAGAGTLVIEAQPALASGFKVTEAGAKATIAFDPTGTGATSAALTVCRATPAVSLQQRVVRISAAGRTNVSKSSASSCG